MLSPLSILSLIYLCFIIVLALVYYLVPGRGQWIVLLAGSVFFYLTYGKKVFLILVVTSFLVYAAGLLFQWKKKNLFPVLGIVVTACLLIFLKYSGYFSGFGVERGGVFSAFRAVFGPADRLMKHYSIVVPLGISFYSLQLISYLSDIMHAKIAPERNFFRFFLTVSFFPHIMQGPIERFEDLADQFRIRHRVSWDRFVDAGLLMA